MNIYEQMRSVGYRGDEVDALGLRAVVTREVWYALYRLQRAKCGFWRGLLYDRVCPTCGGKIGAVDRYVIPAEGRGTHRGGVILTPRSPGLTFRVVCAQCRTLFKGELVARYCDRAPSTVRRAS